jgi:hypothetical protein
VTAGSPKQNHPTARRWLQVGLFVGFEVVRISDLDGFCSFHFFSLATVLQ